MSATQTDANMFENENFLDTSVPTDSMDETPLPPSLKEEINRDLSILLANTDDFGFNNDLNIDSFVDFSNVQSEQTQSLYSNNDFGLSGDAITPITMQDSTFYQHMNKQISPLSNTDDSSINAQNENNMIDSKLLEEIESVLSDTKSIGIKSPNRVAKTHIPKRPQKIKISNTNTQDCTTKKSNSRSLSLPLTQSSTSHRLVKQRAMAQTAAVLATSTMPITKGNTCNRNESAKAAARAVGQLVPLPKSKVANSPTMNLSPNFKNATKIQRSFRSSKADHNMLDSKQTQILPQQSRKSPVKGLNLIIPNNRSIPASSTSIISTTTGLSSKSYSSKESSTFDVPPPTFRSTETFETILSQITTSPQIPLFSPINNNNNNTKTQFDTNISERRNSTASSDSTSSMNSLSEFLNLSTPSPTSANLPNSTFSPHNASGNRSLSFNTSPVTPVSKTAAIFEMLSTKSPITNSNIDSSVQNGPKMSIWKTPKSTAKQKSTSSKQKSIDFENIKGFGILELSVDKARLKAKPIDATIRQNLPKQDFAGRIKTNHISNKSSLDNNYTHTSPVSRKMRVHASSTSSGSNMSVTSTVSTVSMNSNKDDKFIPHSQLTKKSITSNNTQQIPKRKNSDLSFQSLITTFNKHEAERTKPQVYSNMHQGLVEFQLKLDSKRKTLR
ncbi:hypothetical protein CANINC_004275 [Pichia inconspicua]|uniref:Uncharacterized protein n=1 Tax=Pichia inconspicua TaxID=52247 RepID=A0A4T0WWI1_9ASCO|nr:hypothetical protein CANINC_004275 [[Candida] inconspicua]